MAERGAVPRAVERITQVQKDTCSNRVEEKHYICDIRTTRDSRRTKCEAETRVLAKHVLRAFLGRAPSHSGGYAEDRRV